MPISNRKRLPRYNFLKILSAAIVIYGAFFTIRFLGYQPPNESGLGDFITALFFIFGASVAYFIFILHNQGDLRSRIPSGRWWYMVGAFLMLLAFDEIFMIHEYVCWWLGIRDLYLFMVYGLILMSLIFVVRKILTRTEILLLAAFVVLSGIAVISDTVMGEGMITVFNRAIDFEQLAESFSAFFLASTFVALGVRQLRPRVSRIQPVVGAHSPEPAPDRRPVIK